MAAAQTRAAAVDDAAASGRQSHTNTRAIDNHTQLRHSAQRRQTTLTSVHTIYKSQMRLCWTDTRSHISQGSRLLPHYQTLLCQQFTLIFFFFSFQINVDLPSGAAAFSIDCRVNASPAQAQRKQAPDVTHLPRPQPASMKRNL